MQRELCATIGDAEHSVTATCGDDDTWTVMIDGNEYRADACEVRPGTWSLLVGQRSWVIDLDERRDRVMARLGMTRTSIVLEDARRKRLAAMAKREGDDGGALTVLAPIAGKVVKVSVSVGTEVTEGEGIVVLEAMKMENELKAPRAAKVVAVHVEPGQSVDTQEPLLDLE